MFVKSNNINKVNVQKTNNQSFTEKTYWSGRQLRNSTRLGFNIPDPRADLNLDTTPLNGAPLHVASFKCNDFKSPIDEVVVARYPFGLITAIIFARTGVGQQLLLAVRPKKINSIWCTNFKDDLRNRIALTTTCEKETELQRMTKFTDVIGELTEYVSWIKEYTTILFAPDNKEAKPISSLEYLPDLTPPYFRYSKETAYIGAPSHYLAHSDQIIPNTIPALHLAIVNNDFEKIVQITSQDPWSVVKRDALGLPGFRLAQGLGSFRIFKYLVELRNKLIEDAEQANLNLIIKKSHSDLPAEDREQAIISYFENLKKNSSLRSVLHQACITGSLQSVKENFHNFAQLEELDPLGFTPLILAAGNGHADVVEWLIEQGAKLNDANSQHQELGSLTYRLIDHAATPSVMEKILFHYVDPDVVNDRLEQAVKANDYAMVKVLLFYISKLPTNQVGLTPLDIVIKNSSANDTRILDLFLTYWEDYVPKAPYDKDIPDVIAEKLVNHNLRIQKKLESKAQRPIITSMQLSKDIPSITTELQYGNDIKIISNIRTMNSLTDDERKQCFELFTKTFQMMKDDSPANRKTYFDKLFITSAHDTAYIDVCKIGDEIISFLAFELRECEHSSIGKFLLYHGQLGANNPHYESLGLANLAFRVALAMKDLHKETPVIIFVKAIQPGFGFCLLPKPIKFFPKYEVPNSLVNYIVSLTGEKVVGHKMQAKLQVINRSVRGMNFPLEQYRHFIGEKVEDAMAIAYYVDKKVIADYVNVLSPHGVDSKNMGEFFTLWNGFVSLPKINLNSKF